MREVFIHKPKPPFKLPTTEGEKVCVDCGKSFKTANVRTAKYCPECKQKRRAAK